MSRNALRIACCVLALAGACTSGDDPPANNAGTGVSGSGAGTGGGAGTNGDPTSGSGGASAGTGSAGMPGAGTGGGAGTASAGQGGTGASGSGGSEPPPVECDSDMDIMTGMECAEEANGVFAIKTEIDVWWQDDAVPPLVDPGRGKIVVYLRGVLTDVCKDGSNGSGEITVCGTELPPFVSYVNCDAYQITFPDELWDLPTMPKIFTTGSTTGFTPGSILTIASATGLLGVDMTDPNGTWPMSAGGLMCAAGTGGQCFPDHDGDGKPGISIVMGRIGEKMEGFETNGCGLLGDLPVVFRGAPISGDPLVGLCNAPEEANCHRADKLAIGVRSRLGGSGAINADCMSGVGDAMAESVDSRVWDCTMDDGTPCAPEEAGFVDSAAPTYNILAKDAAPPSNVMRSPCECPGGCVGPACPVDQTPSKGTRSALVRLGNADQNFTCADVRAAPYPAFP